MHKNKLPSGNFKIALEHVPYSRWIAYKQMTISQFATCQLPGFRTGRGPQYILQKDTLATSSNSAVTLSYEYGHLDMW